MVGPSLSGSNTQFWGGNGTGGLLVVYANNLENTGTIDANGTTGGHGTSYGTRAHAYGGSSGGGSVNIFYSGNYSNTGNITANGGTTGGIGGNGTVTIGSIETGTFVEYKEPELEN